MPGVSPWGQCPPPAWVAAAAWPGLVTAVLVGPACSVKADVSCRTPSLLRLASISAPNSTIRAVKGTKGSEKPGSGLELVWRPGLLTG